MDQQGSQQQSWGNKDSFNLLFVGATGLATCITPFSRRNCGREYPGVAGLVAMGIILVVAEQSRDPAMLDFFWCWLAALALMRIQTLQMVKRGAIIHSRYSGDPWLLKFSFVKSRNAARGLEIFLCLGIAALLSPVSHALAGFLAVCSLGLGLVALIEGQRNCMQVTRAQDARIEMQVFQERMQGQRHDY